MHFMEGIQFRRHRRLRRTETLRALVRETDLAPAHLVYPVFVEAGLSGRSPIAAMPGQDRLGLDALAAEARELSSLGIGAVLLFGLPAAKDERGLPPPWWGRVWEGGIPERRRQDFPPPLAPPHKGQGNRATGLAKCIEYRVPIPITPGSPAR